MITNLRLPLTGGDTSSAAYELSSGGALTKKSGMPLKHSVVDIEIDWAVEVRKAISGERRGDAIRPILFTRNWASLCRCSNGIRFFALCFVLNKDWLDRMKYVVRRSRALASGLLEEYRLETKRKNEANKTAREAARRVKMSDPVRAKAARIAAVESFKRNKVKVYAYRKKQRQTNPQFQIGCNLRTYIYQRVGAKNTTGQSRFLSIVGCSIEVFCQWLEAHFEPWMNWNNCGKGDGKWSIDHTRPCASFDLTDPEQVKQCFHYTNMLPMCWRKNLEKRDTFLPSQSAV